MEEKYLCKFALAGLQVHEVAHIPCRCSRSATLLDCRCKVSWGTLESGKRSISTHGSKKAPEKVDLDQGSSEHATLSEVTYL